MSRFTSLTFNLANAPIRKERLHGRDYIVAPMAMLTEGVHNGSGGALLYRGDDCRKAVPAWNMKPIVVYHPELNGQGVSACDPDILEKQQVGMVMNTRWDGKLRAEAWIEEKRAHEVDGRVIEALEENRQMEVSTGLFTDNLNEDGEWNGEKYSAIATNHQPDHLALLPDRIGACSIADGAGLLQLNEAANFAGTDATRRFAQGVERLRRMVGNAMGHNSIHKALSAAVRAKAGSSNSMMTWVVDVFDDFFIYESESEKIEKLYRQEYTKSDTGVELKGEPEEVVRVTEYRNAKGDFVGNGAHVIINQKKECTMNKEALVNALIANASTQWSEEDRKNLMGMEVAVLNKMTPTVNDGEAGGVKKTEEAVPATEVKTEPSTEAAKVPVTMEAYLAQAPAEYRDVLQNGLAAHNAAKSDLIKRITANKRNKFSEEFLGTKGLAELQGLAELAADSHDEPGGNAAPAMFFGQATPANAPVVNAEGDDEPLVAPPMDFAG